MNLERLKQVLACREKQTTIAPGRIPSAVLLPIYCKGGEYHLLFTKRTEGVKVHKGQISFPGGSYQREDGTLLETALREAAEEVGISRQDVEVMGCLDDVIAHSSGYIISPFVALIRRTVPFTPNCHEVEEIIEVPIRELVKETPVRQETELRDNEPVPVYFYYHKDRIIWGATARILNQLLAVVSPLLEE